jgi:hypothetical protein
MELAGKARIEIEQFEERGLVQHRNGQTTHDSQLSHYSNHRYEKRRDDTKKI